MDLLEDVGHWVGERIDDLGKFYSVAFHGNTGDEAVPAPELARKVLAGPGTSVWHEGAGRAVQLSSEHHEASDLVSRMSTGLESAWTGKAADAAQTRIRALAEIASVSAAIYTTNGANLSDVAHGFDAMKTSLQPMPDQPPHLTFLDRITPWETDAEREIHQYNAVAQQNVDRYQAYVQHARTGSQQLQADYGRLDDFGGRSTTAGSQLKAGRKPDDAPHFPKPRNPGHPPDAPPPASAPPTSGPSTRRGPSEKTGPGMELPSRTGDQTVPSGWTQPSSDPATTRDWVPPAAAPRTGESGSGSASWSSIPVQGNASTGGEGRSGGNTEARSRAGSPPKPGPGGRTGGGEEGRPGSNTARGTSATPGKTGSRGTPGAGGITPTRGKDKNEDSQEHHRKYGLETDDAFSLTDDDGERTVDPRTGLPRTAAGRTAPRCPRSTSPVAGAC
ncbi:hypothetical protein [Amycolatopsis circi]|uniref:hypothetical protein n=1 Tax=Amycolatopsis circi TaxID=871959 RepID=UPI0013BE99B9|nr:hypothetical protein [Amycolatopsis circi]